MPQHRPQDGEGYQKRYVRLTKEYKELEDLMAARKEYANLLSNLEESKDMLLNETDAEMKDMAREEVAECEKRIPELEERIKLMLVPKDPELSIQQAMMDYKRLGYSDNWINQRLKSIEIRKDLTDQWKLHNVEEGIQYATLTDIIYQHWAGKTAKEYKEFKGLKKENLRDNMTNEELVLNMLAELSTTSITKSKNPQTLEDNMKCAADGGDVARVAREQLEAKTGRNVVSPLSAKRFFEEQKDHDKIEGGE